MTKEEIIALSDELRKRGIVMHIGGCGCCGSPWVKIEIDGVVVTDEADFHIDMFEEVKK